MSTSRSIPVCTVLTYSQPPLHPPALPASSSSPAALPAPDSTASEPESKNRSSSQRRTMMIWLWVHSIPCSQLILHYYLLLNNNTLLPRILRLADRVVEHIAKPQRLQPLPFLNLVMICHVSLDKRNLLFHNSLHNHLTLRHEAPR